jgi:hypothetical protein
MSRQKIVKIKNSGELLTIKAKFVRYIGHVACLAGKNLTVVPDVIGTLLKVCF